MAMRWLWRQGARAGYFSARVVKSLLAVVGGRSISAVPVASRMTEKKRMPGMRGTGGLGADGKLTKLVDFPI